jgi:hypothetical protein
MRFHVTRKRRYKNNINNRIDDNRNIKHSVEKSFSGFCVGGANIFDETFMFELHISTALKSYSNWRIKTFISRDDHYDAKQKRP